MSSDILGKVTKDGSSGFKAEKDRYHLYTAHGCPFAHRLVISLYIFDIIRIIVMNCCPSYSSLSVKTFLDNTF